MAALTDLIMQYETKLVGFELTEYVRLFSEQLEGASEEMFRPTFESNLKSYELMLNFANSRRQEGDLSDIEIKDLNSKLGAHAVPKGVLEYAANTVRQLISERVSFYQNLLKTEGKFDTWQELLSEKYGSGKGYMGALDNLIKAEKSREEFEDILVGDSMAVYKPITKENKARAYSREQIINEVRFK